MTKRLIDLDDDLFAEVQQATGEPTIKGTVTEALRLLVAQRGLRGGEIRSGGTRWTMRWRTCRTTASWRGLVVTATRRWFVDKSALRPHVASFADILVPRIAAGRGSICMLTELAVV